MPPHAATPGPAAASSVVVVADVPPGRGRSGVYDVTYVVSLAGFVALFAWLIVRGVRGSKARRDAPPDDPAPPAP